MHVWTFYEWLELHIYTVSFLKFLSVDLVFQAHCICKIEYIAHRIRARAEHLHLRERRKRLAREWFLLGVAPSAAGNCCCAAGGRGLFPLLLHVIQEEKEGRRAKEVGFSLEGGLEF